MAEIQEQDVIQRGPFEGMVPQCFVELKDDRASNTVYLVMAETVTEAKVLKAATPTRNADYFGIHKIFPNKTPGEMAEYLGEGYDWVKPGLKWEIVERFPPLPPLPIRCCPKPARTEADALAEMKAELRKARRHGMRSKA